jgi:hypothetical protein
LRKISFNTLYHFGKCFKPFNNTENPSASGEGRRPPETSPQPGLALDPLGTLGGP